MHPGAEAEIKAQKWLDERGLAGEFLLVNVNGERAVGHWKAALQVLAARRPLVLIGNAPCQSLANVENVFDLGGRVDLLVLAALCERARAFIGGDNGLLQMAHAMQTPIIEMGENDEAEILVGAVNELMGV